MFRARVPAAACLAQPSQLTAYMLVNTLHDLQARWHQPSGETRTRLAGASALPELQPLRSRDTFASGHFRRQWGISPTNLTISDQSTPQLHRPCSGASARRCAISTSPTLTSRRQAPIAFSRRARGRECRAPYQQCPHARSGIVSGGSRPVSLPAVWSVKTAASSPAPARPPPSASEIPIPRPPRILRADWLPPISGPSRTRRRAAT